MTDTTALMINAQNLGKAYQRGVETVHALADFTMEVAPGEVVGIVGRSGSGKTTFLNLVGCLDRPTTGELWIAGRNVTELPESALVEFRRNHIGFVFQLFYLVPTLTALDNITLPLLLAGRKVDDRVRELCQRVGLEGKLKLLPNSMSGGDRQRVAIARALVNRPSVLLADEPTGRLESESRDEILALFQELRVDGLAIIMATHDLEQAAQCDRVVELRDGKALTLPLVGA